MVSCTNMQDTIMKLKIMEIQEFNRLWNNFYSTLLSTIIRCSKESEIDVDKLNNDKLILLQKWFNSQKSEGLWYNNLIKTSPEMAQEFRHCMETFTFHKCGIQKPQLMRYYSYGVAISIMLTILAIVFFSGWKAFFIALMCVMLTFAFVIPFGQHQVDKANREESILYINQLNDLQKLVYNILKIN